MLSTLNKTIAIKVWMIALALLIFLATLVAVEKSSNNALLFKMYAAAQTNAPPKPDAPKFLSKVSGNFTGTWMQKYGNNTLTFKNAGDHYMVTEHTPKNAYHPDQTDVFDFKELSPLEGQVANPTYQHTLHAVLTPDKKTFHDGLSEFYKVPG
jgi:hypothetical protein